MAVLGGRSGCFSAEFFLQLEEGLKDLVRVMEVVVNDVDEQRIVHYVRNELA